MSQKHKKELYVFKETFFQLKDSHYEIAKLWTNSPPCLPNNRQIAEIVEVLKKKLTRNSDMYGNFPI